MLTETRVLAYFDPGKEVNVQMNRWVVKTAFVQFSFKMEDL